MTEEKFWWPKMPLFLSANYWAKHTTEDLARQSEVVEIIERARNELDKERIASAAKDARIAELEYASGYGADLACIDKVLNDCDAPHDPEDGVSLAPKRIRLVATQLVHAQSMREKAERERDEALARVKKLEAHRLSVAMTVGRYHDMDGVGVAPCTDAQAIEGIEALKNEANMALARAEKAETELADRKKYDPDVREVAEYRKGSGAADRLLAAPYWKGGE